MKTIIQLSIDVELKKRALAKNMNISAFVNDALHKELKKDEAPAEGSFEATFEENRKKSEEAARAYQADIEEKIRIAKEKEEREARERFEAEKEALTTRYRHLLDEGKKEEAAAIRQKLSELSLGSGKHGNKSNNDNIQ